MTKNKRFTFLVSLVSILILSIPVFIGTKYSSAKNKTQFLKTYSAVQINKTLQYKMKYLPKNSFVTYHVSNTSLASIHKSSGRFHAKKIGTVVVSAKVFSRKGTLLTTKKDKLYIKPVTRCLKQANFKTKEPINAFDFTLSLTCNRIVLKSEVQNSKLYFYPASHNQPVFIANFLSISSDGKKITYRIPKKYKAYLCPGNASMNQTFSVYSSIFRNRLSVSYQERFSNNSIYGFILTQQQQPVSNAQITLTTKKNTKLKTYSDKNGFYRFSLKNQSPNCISVKKAGFYSASLSSLNLSDKGPVAENFILHPTNSDFTFSFCVKKSDNSPLSDHKILMLPSSETNINSTDASAFHTLERSEHAILGTTNQNGFLTFSSKKECSISSYTEASFHSSWNIALHDKKMNFSNNTVFSKSSFSPSKPYTVFLLTKNNQILFYYNITPVHFLTNGIYFSITIPENNSISLQNLSLKTKTKLTNTHQISFTLYSENTSGVLSETSLSLKDVLLPTNHISFSNAFLPIHLPDGTYYLRLTVKNRNKTPLEYSSITKVSIQNSKFSPVTINTSPPLYAKVLLYTDSYPKAGLTASFTLYEQKDKHLFHIGDFVSDYFDNQTNSYLTASLVLSKLHPDASYILYPKSDTLTISSPLQLCFVSDNLYSHFQGAYNAIAGIQCKCTLYNHSNMVPPLLPDISYSKSLYDLSDKFLRTCNTYPNALLVTYNKRGQILSNHFFISNQLQNYSSMDTKNTSIYDIYINNIPIFTNQKFMNNLL